MLTVNHLMRFATGFARTSKFNYFCPRIRESYIESMQFTCSKATISKRRSPLFMCTDSCELRFFSRTFPSGTPFFSRKVSTPTKLRSDDSSTEFSAMWLQQQATDWLYETPLAQWDKWGRSEIQEEGSSSSLVAMTTKKKATLGVSIVHRDKSKQAGNSGDRVGKGVQSSKVLNPTESTPQRPVCQGYGSSITLSEEERELFSLLRRVRKDTNLATNFRVAGGWVRDKLLATPEFNSYHAVFEVAGKRLTSKCLSISTVRRNMPPQPSMGRLGTNILSANDAIAEPVDIDIALDDMLGREFAEHLNEYLSSQGEETYSVGVVLKNPERSKHLETATMKVGSFWIDFVNLRAEEYTQDSRIPELMRIGTASEDAFRRDLTINSLFYNINTGEVEDWTGRGFDDLRKGIVATPLPALTTLLDDPLRVLRSVRFAARLRFIMEDKLTQAAQDVRVRNALAEKVSRERVGGEVELMLRSPDPVGAMRLLIELNLIETVFPQMNHHQAQRGLSLLSTVHDHLADCKWSPPLWCRHSSNSPSGLRLLEDEQTRRLLWYTSFLKPLVSDQRERIVQTTVQQSKKQTRKNSLVKRLIVEDLKRPVRDAEDVERILAAADEIAELMQSGGGVSSTMVLLSDINIRQEITSVKTREHSFYPFMSGRKVDPTTEQDPVWVHAMDFRLTCAKILKRIGSLWQAALILSLSEELNATKEAVDFCHGDDENLGELHRGIIEKYDIFGAAVLRLGLVGSWDQKNLLDGATIKKGILPNIPAGPAFRDVMEEQSYWIATHPGADAEALARHLQHKFPEFLCSDTVELPPVNS